MASTYDRLKKIVVEQLGVDEDEVKPEASFVDDLNADSLDLVELIMSLEEEFGTEISDEDAEKIRTVGDAVEYIDETGATHRYRVQEVVHTLQTTSAHRPHVADGRASPQAIARVDDGDQAEPPGEGGELRAGLPKVILEVAD